MKAITVAGEVLQLLAERAVFWPRRSTLFVADMHFGKASAFRAAGLAVPEGALADDLKRLSRAIERTGAERVIILGDALHARSGLAESLLAAVTRWRLEHTRQRFVVVRGNHDRHAGDPPPEWGMVCVEAPYIEPPFALCHVPGTLPNYYTLAGHVHPAMRLRGRAGLSERLLCFVVGTRRMILPAFGSFTGSATVQPESDDRIYAIAGDVLVEIP